jgi:hypothetical protein
MNQPIQDNRPDSPALQPVTRLRRVAPYGVVLLVALLWRILLLLEIQDTPLAFWHQWENTDMAKFLDQARLIASGDYLIRDPLIPDADWMHQAPAELQNAWHRDHQLYQPPLYSLFLAALNDAGLDEPHGGRLIQILLGCGICLLMVRLTTNVFNLQTGFIAGLITAVYGPLMIVETQLLRGTLNLFLTMLSLALFASWWTHHADHCVKNQVSWKAGGRLFSAMFILGVLAMAHESALFPAILVTSAVSLRLYRENRKQSLRWLVICAGCWLIGCSPLIMRNLYLGLSPLEPYFGSMMAVASANHAARPVDMLTNYFPDGFYLVMIEGKNSLFQLCRTVAHTYDGEWCRWFTSWLLRVFALLIGTEHNENLSYAYFRHIAPVLSFCLDFRVLLPLTGAGLATWFRCHSQDQPSRRILLYILLGYGLMTFGLLSIVYPFGRYRLMLLPVMMPFAGYAVVHLAGAFHLKKQRHVVILLLLIAGLASCQAGLDRVRQLGTLGRLRPADFLVASRMLYQWGHPDYAASHLEEGIALGADSPQMHLEADLARGQALYMEGNLKQARRSWMKALESTPRNRVATERLRQLDAKSNGGPNKPNP